MARVHRGLAPEQQSLVRLLSVGYFSPPGVGPPLYGAFCSKGRGMVEGSFGVCADSPLGGFPWHKAWSPLYQRDVLFFVRVAGDEGEGGEPEWMFACRYSMNTRTHDFEGTIKELLDVSAAPGIDNAGNDADADADALADSSSVIGNSTSSNSSTSIPSELYADNYTTALSGAANETSGG